MPEDPAETFQGFHEEAVAFFRGLAADNTKAYWLSHRGDYDQHVKAPMVALARTLEGAFGAAHVYRPYRDQRFTKDKTPYKLHAAVSFGGRGPTASAGRYLQFDATGLFAGAGAYMMTTEALRGYRRAIDDTNAGERLEAILEGLQANGYELHGEVMARGPRDVDPDHPRIELLKRKGLFVSQGFGLEPWVFEPQAADRIARVFADAEPLVAWLQAHLG